MKKILAFIPLLSAVILLAACTGGDQGELNEMYEAFDRNHAEIEADFEEQFNQIEETGDRESQLKIIYDEMIPRLDDFKTTIQNYSVTNESHVELKDDMLGYIDSLKELIEMNGEFNRTFTTSNPLGEDSFSEDVESMLEEIENKENELSDSYDDIVSKYEDLTGEYKQAGE